jgi:2-polyprenyl-3-methyl-5-hydroxy-6-metoxy-1,4-benzoquinol methylase
LLKEDDFRKKIRDANINVHRIEAKYYDLIHPEVYGKFEQKRINSILKKVDKLVKNNIEYNKRALDFGSGTGNITGKLLELGYTVTAVDISSEMCRILEKKFKNYL